VHVRLVRPEVAFPSIAAHLIRSARRATLHKLIFVTGGDAALRHSRSARDPHGVAPE
jgi:hypothetical protein